LPLLAILALLQGCGGISEGSSGGSGPKLSLVAYSTPREAYEQLTKDYGKARFSQSYGASGDQARAVIAGLPTDVVALSLEPDISKLVKEGLVAEDWRTADHHGGFVTKSVVVLAVRKGNPKNIRSWADLVRPGVEVLTPNPFTSGGARWNVMAAYGAQIAQGSSEPEAVAYLGQLFKNVPVQDKSAREALQSFVAGKGDVLIAYENEAITAQQKGEDLDYVIPDETILIENPIAVAKESKNAEAAKAFTDYLRTDPAQKVFAEKGYRSVNAALVDAARYPAPAKLFDIRKFGGWDAVMKKFFDPDKSVMQQIEEGLGVGTS